MSDEGKARGPELGTTRTIVPPKAAGAQRQGLADVPAATPPDAADPHEELPLPAGTRIRQYEIIRELGRGGMGRVLLARDTKLGRRVAMKFLTAGSLSHTERFLVEARTTARLTHENIVVIHEVDEHRLSPYMVLEYLEGSTLRKQLKGPLPAGRAIDLAVPIVRALVRAHEAGIVHRDLKPENVFLTDAGLIKVLDFGIAKLMDAAAAEERALPGAPRSLEATAAGSMVGTLPYMSPEQFTGTDVDHQSDIWAIGVILFEMVTGQHPVSLSSSALLMGTIPDLDQRMPAVGTKASNLPEALERIIDRCLMKRRSDRYPTAKLLLDDLETLVPSRRGRQLAEDESPYPGLASFQEGDADRFFGRGHDVARTLARIRDQPLVGIVGPSGAGKSSFLRAGIIPELKASEPTDVEIVRPGRHPFASLAHLLTAEADRLQSESGHLGMLLRERAREKAKRIVLVVDQFEELYTLSASSDERIAFTQCLLAAADDLTSPVRIVISMRSDFLDRAGEDRAFLESLTHGLIFLQQLGAAALRDALVAPLDARGYSFEEAAVVDEIVAALASTSGALPLLQFAATRLWEARDRAKKVLTRASYEAIGGISGALAAHADQALTALIPARQKLVRTVFERLVTPERTRSVVEIAELRELAADPREVEQLVDQLATARLLVVQGKADAAGGTVEIVHESLIATWPTLRRWLDESHDDVAYLAQLRAAASQWEQRGRAQGLLWRGEALDEAKAWHARYAGDVPARERAYLDAVFALGARSARIKRIVITAIIAFLSLAVVGGIIALISIRNAEHDAQDQAEQARGEKAHANEEAARAQKETERALRAEAVAEQRLREAEAEKQAKEAAQGLANERGTKILTTEGQLREALAKAQQEKQLAQKQEQAARDAADAAKRSEERERQARDQAEQLFLKEKARADEAEKQRSKITNSLPK